MGFWLVLILTLVGVLLDRRYTSPAPHSGAFSVRSKCWWRASLIARRLLRISPGSNPLRMSSSISLGNSSTMTHRRATSPANSVKVHPFCSGGAGGR
jgi:hypothetical protein